ncbi:ATP-dependent helicase protein [Rhizobium phage RHph_TM3_3_9]|nr:ATP-dependent helicase protein [Rhizobium phage RHph_TM3_3_9]QIG67804.1 ATP-dependent helicase protein [Rhizobium phage RHph_Y60]QIG74382.1 ATP-dependent helicase protein [Rhizobium phage RHph_TM3_3_10]QXV74494.1 ATP-dependent helicase protein [Rhizobium phage RHEph19]
MTVNLRSYQTETKQKIFDSWHGGNRNVLAVLPTGSGKTITIASIIKDMSVPTCLSVHRAELVAQLSESLALLGIVHRVVGSESTYRLCVARHVKKFGKSFVHQQSPVGVVSIQTLVKRFDELKQWIASIRLWIGDEAHHFLGNNQFGKIPEAMPNALGLGATATPLRCDRRSLAAVQGGVFHDMIEGPSPAWMIEQGYLANYRYIAENPSIVMTAEDISESTGEFKSDNVRKKSHESKIVGDIVQTYLDNAAGLAGITFTVDVETAIATAEEFNRRGVPAAAVHGKMPDSIRVQLMDKFTERRLLQLVNVDLFDEGLDIPGVDVVSMGRPTMSLGKFRQQAGRQIRPVYAPGFDLTTQEGRLAAIAAGPKPKGIIIDHVNNWLIHKMPASPRKWYLISEEKGKKARDKDDEIPLTNCKNCKNPYERIKSKCPHCDHKPEPIGRSLPEMVDGDLVEFSEELMMKLHGQINRLQNAEPAIPLGASEVVVNSIKKRRRELLESHGRLAEAIKLWAGVGRDLHGETDSELYRRFFHTFGVDVMSAQALDSRPEVDALETKVRDHTQRRLTPVAA